MLAVYVVTELQFWFGSRGVEYNPSTKVNIKKVLKFYFKVVLLLEYKNNSI